MDKALAARLTESLYFKLLRFEPIPQDVAKAFGMDEWTRHDSLYNMFYYALFVEERVTIADLIDAVGNSDKLTKLIGTPILATEGTL